MFKLLYFIVFCLIALQSWAVHLNVVTEHRIPLNYLNEKGEIVGDATQIVRKILESSDVSYSMEVYSWARAYYKAQNEPNTMIFSIRRTKEREHKFHWICPLIESEREFIYRLSSRDDIQIVYFNDAKSYSLGVVRDDFTHEKLVTNGFIEGKHLDVNNDGLANLKKLLKGRVDLIVQSDRSIERRMTALKLPLSTVTPVIPFELDQPTCMGFNKKTDPEILDKITKSHGLIFKN